MNDLTPEQFVDVEDYYDAVTEQFKFVGTRAQYITALAEIAALEPSFLALDFETTALTPEDGEVRLTTLTCKQRTWVFDHWMLKTHFRVLLTQLRERLGHVTYVVYNAKFEIRWIDYWFPPYEIDVLDVDYMAKVKLGGYASNLARMCKRDLGIDISKDLQNSDWSSPDLTDDQLFYAAKDGVVTWALFEYWNGELTDEQWQAVDVFNDCVRGTIECEDTGLQLDVDLHQENCDIWEMKKRLMEKVLRRYTPEHIIKNLNSAKQVGKFIESQLDRESLLAWPKTEKKKELKLDKDTLRPIAAKAQYPFSRWLNALIQYNYYRKYTGTYGEKFITKQMLSGRISSRFNIAQAATGRYSSSSDNLQSIPRKIYVRRAFTTDDEIPEQRMVLADYSGIEVRVLAELSQDKQLLQDAIYGDVHSGSASVIFGIDEDHFLNVINWSPTEGDMVPPNEYYYFKELRSKAKGFTFQLTYGAAAAALSVVLRCSIEEAEQAIIKWAERYPDAYNYRNVIFSELQATGFIPVCDGRTIYVRKPDRSLPVAANYGIQGAAASVMCRAVYRVHRNFYNWRGRDLYKARLAATVHDELLAYTTADDIDHAHRVLVDGMEQGWLDVFPDTSVENLIDSAKGYRWSDKP